MTKKTPGRLVSFATKDGKLQKAIAYNHEQAAEFSNVKKVFIRYIDDNFNPQKDEHGKNLVGLKDAEKLTVIGFVD